MDDDTLHAESTTSILNLAGNGTLGVTPLEQAVLDEYERLLRNMKQLSSTLSALSSGPITLEVAEGLRLLERKVASVYTLLKASVYSIVLQQGQIDGDGETISATESRSGDG